MEEQTDQQEVKAESPAPSAPVPRVANSSDYIEPTFNIRMLRKRLEDANTPVSEIKRLLMGLHYKMWHLPAPEMTRFLKRGRFPDKVVELVNETLAKCAICSRWRLTLTKPRAGGNVLAFHFKRRPRCPRGLLSGACHNVCFPRQLPGVLTIKLGTATLFL